MLDNRRFASALFEGNSEKVKRLIQELLDSGEKAETIINQGLIKAMDQVGVKFKKDEIYIPEVLLAARAMHAGLEMLKPKLNRSASDSAVKIVLGTVKGDLHDIGKNLVGMMLEGGGFEVIDVGIDTPPEKFIQTAKQQGAKVIAISALLTTTMAEMKKIINELKLSGLNNRIKTIIGGAPVTYEFAKTIGADGYAPDAASAVEKVRELLA